MAVKSKQPYPYAEQLGGALRSRIYHKQAIRRLDYIIWELVKKSWRYLDVERNEYTVLRRRLYLKQSLQTIGKDLGISRERVRQIEERAFKRLGVTK